MNQEINNEINAKLNYLITLQKANLMASLALNPTLKEETKIVCTRDALEMSGMFSRIDDMFKQDDLKVSNELDTSVVL